MNLQEQNFVRELMGISETLLFNRDTMRKLSARWFANSHSGISDLELQEIPDFEHLVSQDLADCITAITAVLDALGTDSGGQAANLIKMKG